MDKKLINIVKGDINTAILNGSYNRNTAYQTNIEFNTPTKLILLDGVPYSNPSLTKVTWQELKDLRDNNRLIAGSLYRITDYQCTTTQENTRSAGHRFDIVLLALSENKLAEEGWAMMHDNIYDVTFTDGVTKKCYYYPLISGSFNLVIWDTLLGTDEIALDEYTIDESSKTIAVDWASTELTQENLQYSYFRNSNLSAWKVWYCLDNDKSRFAWADDSVDEGSPAYITDSASHPSYIRNSAGDEQNYFAWKYEDTNIYTETSSPSIGDTVYYYDHGLIEPSPATVSSYTPPTQGTGLPNGRGVIYRLIDEFNNDIKYDFKNIQFKRKITDGQYDANGTETWCYTLNVWYNNMCQDASIVGNTLLNDEGFVSGVYDNKFGYATAYNLYIEGVNTFAFVLGNNVVLSFDNGMYFGIYSNTIGNFFISNTIGSSFCNNIIGNCIYSNIIGNNFISNTIGNNFYSNTIGNNFHANTFGNEFNSKTINDETSYKNYGNNGVELATKDDLN